MVIHSGYPMIRSVDMSLVVRFQDYPIWLSTIDILYDYKPSSPTIRAGIFGYPIWLSIMVIHYG